MRNRKISIFVKKFNGFIEVYFAFEKIVKKVGVSHFATIKNHFIFFVILFFFKL